MNYKIIEYVCTSSDGGAETLVKDYSLMLKNHGYNVKVVVMRRFCNTANDRILTQNGIDIISIYKNNSFLFKVIQRLNRWWYAPFMLKKILSENNADVLHTHLPLLRFIVPISSRIKNVKLFYTCHSEPRIHLGRIDENKATRKLLKNNDLQMIALHEDMRKEINEMFGIDNTVVIRNGIDFNRFRNISKSKEQIRDELNIPADAFVVGHVGRFDDVKNHSFLVDVFIELYKQNNKAFLFLVGAGNLMNSIIEKLNRSGMNGKYLILSHRSDIPELLKAMDIFVFPSKYEGLGIAPIEAQVSGLRCIMSDTIPTEAFQTELAIPMSLSAPIDEWCRVILDDSIKGEAHGDIENYDMNKEIKRLEKLYLGELDE